MKNDFLKLLYDEICREYNFLEDDYHKNPTPKKRKALTLLRSEAYNIDRKLQER